jgi:Stage II sporulation protein E (SpoIIE)
MKINRTLLLLLPLAIAGYALLFTLFPRISPVARWNHQLDRTAAIVKAGDAVARFGLNVAGWPAWVSADREPVVQQYLEIHRDSPLGARLTPTTLRVRFTDPNTGHRFRVDLNGRGELLGFRRSETERRPAGTATAEAPKRSEAALAEDRRLAETALRTMLGEQVRMFPAAPSVTMQKGGSQFSWSVADDRLKRVAEAVVSEGAVTELRLTHAATQRFQAELDAQQTTAFKTLERAENLIFWPALIAIVVIYFIGIARRRINHRRTLTLLAAVFVLALFTNGFGSFFDGFRGEQIISGTSSRFWLQTGIPWIIFLLVNLAFALLAYIYYAPGNSLMARFAHRRTVDFDLLLAGRWRTRPVAESFAAGLLAGGVFAAIPMLVAASGLFGHAPLGARGLVGLLAARSPMAAALNGIYLFTFLAIFAFTVQAVDSWVKQPALAQGLIVLLAFLGFAGATPFAASFGATFVTALGMALLSTWVYSRFGLFATLLTLAAAHFATGAAALLAQPAAGLRTSGWSMVGALLALAMVAAFALLTAREAAEHEIAPDWSERDTRVERERLQAEFDVARRAQEKMLPDAPPRIPGLRIAAVCNPSKEVGGDLYDFLPLPEGKVGVVVADVSGKGVPASLYMTLTKGLLASVSEEKSDPGEILREVNRHLYDVCRRRMFVTLFLGVIDPATRTLTYARAGHNPTVFRSPAEDKTELLKPRGMGLGLNRGKLFDQSLRVESLQLRQADKLFFYSDGITEAMNVRNEEYGEERLMTLAREADPLDAEAARDRVLADVHAFLGANAPQDDQTLVVVQVV